MSHKPDKETLQRWQKDSTNWKWGLFYFNKEDKRIFPPKRVPMMGWTVNFANKWSIMAMIALIAGIVTFMKCVLN